MELKNKKWTEEEFLKIRKEVLATWPTGSDEQLDLDKAVEFLKTVPAHKNFALKLKAAKEHRERTLVQPRAGVPLVEQHIELLQYLEAAGADFVPSTIDAYTRQNRYKEAEEGIQRSREAGRALMNGFPAVNHGVGGCKDVFNAVNVPVQARHGTPDSRLLAEVIHAAGWTSNEGGGISYNVPYAKAVSIEDSLLYWQYCDRLVGYYEDHGVTINREPFGPLTGTLVPPSISNAVGIIEALLAAEQGVKNITVGYGMGGNVVQDVAAIRALQEQTEEYLEEKGYKDCCVTTVFHQWMGGFPADEAEALGLISMSSVVASLAGAHKMINKTPHESIGIPTKEANAQGIKASKIITKLLADQTFPECGKLADEIAQIKKEVKCLLDAVYDLGNGDLAKGTVKAFETGALDIPFAPSKYNAGKILPARDVEGNIRILEFGNLAFNDEIKAFHKAKIAERCAKQGRPVDFSLCIDDIYAVSRGHLVGSTTYKD